MAMSWPSEACWLTMACACAGGNVHDVRQGVEPGLQRPRAQRVPRQRLLHALAVLAAAPELVQVGVLQGPHRFQDLMCGLRLPATGLFCRCPQTGAGRSPAGAAQAHARKRVLRLLATELFLRLPSTW